VEAKRYIAAKSIEQINITAALSCASQETLRQQGGAMSAQQQNLFELKTFFHQAVALRRYDDLGKPEQAIIVSLAPWLSMINKVLLTNLNSS
jgi:predicted HD phosphohydrolase